MEYDSLQDFRERAGYDIDGMWYPRVTAIVSIKSKPALYRYYARMPGIRAADEAKERSAAEGALVHDTAEAILRGEHPVIPESIAPSMDAFLEFLRNADVHPLLVEERVVNRASHYAGTLDLVARVNGVVGVVDIKTSLAVYRDYGLQTAAYRAALDEAVSLPHPETAWVLRLDQRRACELCGARLRTKGGEFRVRGNRNGCLHRWGPMQGEFEFVELPHYAHDLRAFLAAKELWEWEHRDYLVQFPARE
jgi:hypothetical protein